MEPPPRITRLLIRLREVAKIASATLWPKSHPPGMIGLPPSARGLKAVPDDTEEHAKDFSRRYWDWLEAIGANECEVGVPEDRIGMIDADNDFRLAAFHTDQMDGGGVHPPTGRINIDAGLFMTGLLAENMPQEVSSLHDRSRASVRQDAIIAHEYEEGIRGSHESAVEHAPETSLAIKEEARRLLRAQRERSV